jgi:hypothetical protein
VIFSQFGQADPVEALAACAATPATCTAFTSILATLTQIGSDRRVIELVGQAMQRGPEGGTNQFYAAPIALSVVRFHADADPDFAATTIVNALEVVLRDAVTTRASDGEGGFLKSAIGGLQQRLVIRSTTPVPVELGTRAVAVLRQLAASGLQVAPEAAGVLQAMGESVTAPAPTQESADQRAAASAAEAAATSTAPSPTTSSFKIALAVGFGVIAVVGIAILIGVNSGPSPALARARTHGGRLRRKAQAGLRRKGDRSRDL